MSAQSEVVAPQPQCNGICVWASELIVGGQGIAYPHPDCELHGNACAGCSPQACGYPVCREEPS